MRRDVGFFKERLDRAQRSLRISREKLKNLSGLIEASAVVNSTLDLNRLLTVVMQIAKKVMRAEASSLMLIDEAEKVLVYEVALGEKGRKVKERFRLKLGQGIAGWVAKYERPLLVKDVRSDRRFFPSVDKATGFKTRSILCVPMKAKQKTIGIIEAINPTKGRSFENEDVELFSAFANQAAIAIENARMHKRLLEKQRVEQELLIARKIQQSFLPKTYPRVYGLNFFARNIPAREIGGDFYDFLKLERDRIGVAIGDVSGKGVPAALYMAKAMSDFRNFAQLYDRADETLFATNNALIKKRTLGMFVTLLYGILDTKERLIRYSCAGHPSLILVDGSSGRVRSLEGARTLPLGIVPDMDYTQAEVRLKRGDLILFYTDGVIEARGKRGEEFGLGRLKKLVRGKVLSPKQLINEIIGEVNVFSVGRPQHDDLTLLAVAFGA